MSDIKFYYARTGNSLRVAVALELSGVAYTRHETDIANNEQKTPEFIRLNPAGHVPLLVVEGKPLAQSGAITEYLITKHRPDLLPENDIAQAQCKASLYTAVTDITMQNALGKYLADNTQAAEFILNRMWREIDATFEPLRTSPYLLGDKPTLADYANLPTIYQREKEIRKTPNSQHITEWLERMVAEPAVVTAIAYAGNQF